MLLPSHSALAENTTVSNYPRTPALNKRWQQQKADFSFPSCLKIGVPTRLSANSKLANVVNVVFER